MPNPNGHPQTLRSWKPGQSGNPNGRPKRKSFIELLHEHIEAQNSQEKLIAVFHEMLLEKHQYAWKEYLERRDGKVKDELQVVNIPETYVVEYPIKDADYQTTTGTPGTGFSEQR